MSDAWVKQTLSGMMRTAMTGAGLIHNCDGELSDADNLAVLIASYLAHGGADVRFVAVAQTNETEYHHVYTELYHPVLDTWIPIDPKLAPPKYAMKYTTNSFKVKVDQEDEMPMDLRRREIT